MFVALLYNDSWFRPDDHACVSDRPPNKNWHILKSMGKHSAWNWQVMIITVIVPTIEISKINLAGMLP